MNERLTLNEDTKDSVVPSPDSKWEDYMWELTPVEQKTDGMWYKREDKFALLGINTLNGSKCRQLLHLFLKRPQGAKTVVHATNVNASPQTPMTAAMAEHFGLNCIQIAGGTTLEAMNKHELPLFATMFGTKYEIGSKSGFNVNIQKRVSKVMETIPDSFTIERDITLDHRLEKNSDQDIIEFHKVGAHQTKNFPDFIEDLILPFGSANSATSVLFGISIDKPKSLKRIHLVNVGVDKRDYMFERLKIMGADISDYEIIWHDTKVPYSKTMKGISIDDITFHYRYEAKVYDYIKKNVPELIKDTTLFWVIGSVPDLKTTARNIGREIPKSIELYEFKEIIEVDKSDFVENKNQNMDEWGIIGKEKDPILDKIVDTEPTFFYVKGGNGSGKSTIPFLLLEKDPDTYKVFSLKYNKVMFTVFPNAKLLSLGDYEEGKHFGGCDCGLHKQEILYILEYLKTEYLDYSVYFEGSIPSDTIATYFELMQERNERKMVVLFLSTTYDQALERIQKRTGKSDEEMAKLTSVEKKYKRIETAKEVYRKEIKEKALDIELWELNTDQPIEDVFEAFITRDFGNITEGDICYA